MLTFKQFVTELSKGTLASYTRNAATSATIAGTTGNAHKSLKRLRGIDKSTSRLAIGNKEAVRLSGVGKKFMAKNS